MTILTIIMTEMKRGWISYQNDMNICTGQDLDIKTTTIFFMYVIKQVMDLVIIHKQIVFIIHYESCLELVMNIIELCLLLLQLGSLTRKSCDFSSLYL